MKENRTTFRINEPLVTFYHAVMRPIWSDLEHSRDAARLWRRVQSRYQGNVLGPHFEHLCREWIRHLAPADLLGDHVHRVARGTVNDPAGRTSHKIDLVAFGLDHGNRQPVLAIGEAKWGETMGLSHLRRLQRVRALLAAQGRAGAAQARLVCFGGAGFTPDLRTQAAANPDVLLIETADLYQRDPG